MIIRIVAAAAALLLVHEAAAQSGGKIWRVGYLGGAGRVPQIEAFVAGLRELGYVEGKNLVLEFALAEGRPERLPGLARDLVLKKPDVIVAAANPSAVAARDESRSIPIVVIASHDGEGAGLYASLARPGGNLTGLESLAPELDMKRLELLKLVLPGLSRMVLMLNPTDPGARYHLASAEAAARSIGVALTVQEVRAVAEFESAYAAWTRERPDALLLVTDPLTFSQRARIAESSRDNGLPAIFEFKEFTELGGLMSYGPSMRDLWRRGAYYVDRILKGAKPADLPVEQPTKFELVVNLKTAKALGITIPQSILLRADEVIE
jgi:putative ABC transport system substrate-binding protein